MNGRQFHPRLIALAILLILSALTLAAQQPNHDFRAQLLEAEGTLVGALAFQPDGKILVGGDFESVNGHRKYGIARLNSDGTIDPSFSMTVSHIQFPGVTSITVQNDGKIVVTGGIGATVNGSESRGVVRLNSDGSTDQQFSVGNNNSNITVAAVQADGRMIVGGDFGTINGVNRLYIARLNLNGTVDTSFTPNFNFRVMSLLIQADGKIIVGGQFDMANGVPRGHIVRLNPDGSTDPSFTFTSDYNVSALKFQSDGKLLIGRSGLVSGAGFPAIVRLNPDGTTDSGFTCAISDARVREVLSLDLQADGKILASGRYEDNIGRAGGLYRLNTDGSIDSSLAPLPRGHTLYAVLYQHGNILVGGWNGRSTFRRHDPFGNADPNFPGFVGEFSEGHTVKVGPGRKIYVGGRFTSVNGHDRRYIARLNPNGSVDHSFNCLDTNGAVYDIAVQPDGKVIVAGDFGLLCGTPRRRLARINTDGTVDTTFSDALGNTETIRQLKLQPDGKVLVGGTVIARLNTDGSIDPTFSFWDIGGASAAYLNLPNGQYIAGGSFGSIGTTPVGKIARLNFNGSVDTTFNTGGVGIGPSGVSFGVSGLAIQPDGRIVVGGLFSSYNQVVRFGVFRIFPDGSLDPSFIASAQEVFDLRGYTDGRILVGGNFPVMGGVVRNNFARLNVDGTTDLSFASGPGANNWVETIELVGDREIFIVGRFTEFDGQAHAGIAKLGPTAGSAPFDFDGDGKTDVGIFRQSVGEWWINQSSNGVTTAGQFGTSADNIAPADFTGDGKTDIAFFRPSDGFWFVLRSEDSSYFAFPFGSNGDVSVPADYDGDGKADATVFRPSSATWFISRTSDGGTTIAQFGATGDVPVPADYDGDGKADVAIYRPSLGQWWVQRSSAGILVLTFGNTSDKPVQGDFTGDGKADCAFFRPSTGEWFISRSEDLSYYSLPFGTSGDIPAPGDYDGDGKFDPTVFRPSAAVWFSQRSTAGIMIQQFGANGDRPIPNAFVP